MQQVPHPELWEDEPEDENGGEPEPVAVATHGQRAAAGRAEFGARPDAHDPAQEGKGDRPRSSSAAAKRRRSKQPVIAREKGRPQRSLPVRKREKIQKMLRHACYFRSPLCRLSAAIFPDTLKNYQKGVVNTILIPDRALLDEYGLDATEQAVYTAAQKHFHSTAWRFRDSTGAMAMFESKRPPGARLDKITSWPSERPTA